MSTIARRESLEVETMVPYVSGDSLSYSEESYQGFAYRCNGCGLVWAKKHQAERCEGRGHKTSYVDRYQSGGAVVNGVFTGKTTEYERRAIRREKVEFEPLDEGEQLLAERQPQEVK